MKLANDAAPIVLVTGNRHKLAEARRILGEDFGRGLSSESIDLPEIQSLDLTEVLRAKGEEAWSRLERPLIVEETGLELDALNGFPGPLVKWMLEAVGAAGLARTGLALGEDGVTARCALLYRHGAGPEDFVIAEGTTRGRLVAPRGEAGFGWDPVFLPEGEARTFAELSGEEKDRLGHRGRAWRALLDVLKAPRGSASPAPRAPAPSGAAP